MFFGFCQFLQDIRGSWVENNPVAGLILLIQAAHKTMPRVYPARKTPLSQQCLASAGVFVWFWETVISSPILQPLSSSLTSNTHCMTLSRDSEVLPVLVLPCYITHHKMGRSQFLGSALFPEGERLLLGTPMLFCAHSMAGC